MITHGPVALNRPSWLLAAFLLAVLATTAACFGGSTSANDDGREVCQSNEAVLPEPAVATEADIYLDASESMRGYISDAEHPIPNTPFQKLLATSLLEKLSDSGVAPQLHTFGEVVNPTPLSLRELNDFVSARSRYSEGRSDIVAALATAGERPSSVSVIVTDNAQDLKYAKEGRDPRAPGFDRSAIVRTVSQELAAKGFGVWLLGSQSPFDGTYYSLQLSLSSSGASTNLPVLLRGGKERPFYLWIVSRDWEKGRRLASDLHDELIRLSSTGVDAQAKVNVIELAPGFPPDLRVEEPDDEEVAQATARPANSIPVDLLRVRRWTSAGQGISEGELVLQRPRTSNVLFLLKTRMTTSDDREGRLSLPIGAWKVIPKTPLSFEARLSREFSHLVKPLAADASLDYWELSIPYNRLAAQPRNQRRITIPLLVRSEKLPADYWLRAWSTDSDVSPEQISGKTLFLHDLAKSILEKTAGRLQQRGCAALTFSEG